MAAGDCYICFNCGACRKKKKLRTNYDDIKDYSVDEMARFLAGLLTIPGLKEARVKAMKEWLMEEVEEVEE